MADHFIRYILQVPVETALILCSIDSIQCWKHCSQILVYIDATASHSCSKFVSGMSVMRISSSTTTQMCSYGLRSGDREGHFSTVNSLSPLRNLFEMI